MGGSSAKPATPPSPPQAPNIDYKTQIHDLALAYGKYAPSFVNTNAQIYKAYDPYFQSARDIMGQQITSDAANGFDLGTDLTNQTEQDIRGAQAARGNVLGNAPVGAEALYKGAASRNLYQQRMSNLDSFLRAPSILNTGGPSLGPIQPVANQAFSNLANGPQLNYQNQLAAYGAGVQGAGLVSGATGPNPWMGAASGAASGAVAGTTVYPGIGTAIGALVGGAAGYFGSK